MTETQGGVSKRGVPLDRPNLKELAANRIRSDIFAGRMRPGSHIDQDGLALDMGISRLPVREAIATLEREGIVEVLPRRGARVWRFTPDDLRDHYAIFAEVSRMATERAVGFLTDEQIATLVKSIDGMKGESDGAELERLNDRFHAILNRASNSRRMMWLLGLMSTSMPAEYDTASWASAIAYHERIVELLYARDARAAGAAMHDHLIEAGDLSIQALERSGLWRPEA